MIYANRHFLREAAAEGVTDLRVNRIPRRTGELFPSLGTAEVDDVDKKALASYNTILRRHTPVGSRPPTAYSLLHSGDDFEAWARDRSAGVPIQHYALGNALSAAGVPVCSDLKTLSGLAGARQLAYVEAPTEVVLALDRGDVPDAWRTPSGLRPVTDGVAKLTVTVPSAGRWRLWVGGSVRGRLTAEVDGKRAGSVRHQLEWSGEWQRLDELELGAGSHELTLEYSRGGPLSAGRGSDRDQTPLGPVALTPGGDAAAAAVERIPADEYRELCDGRALDWVEVVP